MKFNNKDLVIFDFDGTLINTQLPDEGKKIWLEKTGEEWKYRGWWGRSESLNTEVFEHPANEWVAKQYEKACEIGAHKIILTGRLKYLKDDVNHVLLVNNISEMDDIVCNYGGRTVDFKLKVMSDLLENNKDTLERVVMYDDREEHFSDFKRWAVNAQKRYGIKIVVDKVVNGVGHYEL